MADYQMAGQGILSRSDVVAVGDEECVAAQDPRPGLLYQCEVHRAVVVQDQKAVLASYDRMLHRSTHLT